MIRVMGAGAFGTALAISLAQRHSVMLWARDAGHSADMQKECENKKRLPGVIFPKGLGATSDAAIGVDSAATLLAVPTQKLRNFCNENKSFLGSNPLIACCKGVELSTGMRATEVILDCIPEAVTAILTGPSFAADIARGLPTALTLACRDEEVGLNLQKLLTTPNLRLYRSLDVTGAELGGALKNVIAIACGAVIGAGLGESARAALMTRGFAEIIRVAESMGALPETLTGLSGFGDLALTCASDQSRNYRFGLCLGRNEEFDPSVTVEGVSTAHALVEVAQKSGIEIPITRAVTALCNGELRVDQAMDMLLSRPLKEE